MKTLCIVKTGASLSEVKKALAPLNAKIYEHRFEIGIPDPEYQVGIVWSIDDVQEVRPDLTDGQALQVLRFVKDEHDAEFGINWDTLRAMANTMYGLEPGEGYMFED